MANRPPVRATGFTRFFIAMLIIAPLAYLGASYYNGEDGIANIKKFLKMDSSSKGAESNDSETAKDAEPSSTSHSNSTDQASDEEIRRLKEELEFKTKRNDELYRENEELKRKLESAEKALEESKK